MKMRLDTRKIYFAMAEKGMTATEIAKQGDVSQQAVSNALNGNRMGKVKVVPAIAKVIETHDHSEEYFNCRAYGYEGEIPLEMLGNPTDYTYTKNKG